MRQSGYYVNMGSEIILVLCSDLVMINFFFLIQSYKSHLVLLL